MYDLNNHSKQKRKAIQVSFDPFLFMLWVIFITLTLGYLIPFFQSAQNLLQNIIPNEIDFYHQLIQEQNQTISRIEQEIFNPKMIQQIQVILNHLQQLNITEVQNDIHDIANILNQIIHH
jgi:hypothetical protein